MGRKTLYDAGTFPQLAKEYAEEGNLDTSICRLLGISLTSYYEYQRLYPAFAQSLKDGKAVPDDNVERHLYINATEKMNLGAQIFWLKNRRPGRWRDKQQIETSGPDGQPLEVEFRMSPYTEIPPEQAREVMEIIAEACFGDSEERNSPGDT